MATFVYTVRTQQGKKVNGVIDAATERVAVDRLAADGFLVTSIKAKQGFDLREELGKPRSRVSADELTMFYLQLGNMLEAGLPVLNALETTQGHITDRRFNQAVVNVLSRIHEGESLSEAMSHHPDIFLNLYLRMIEVGEASGNLGKVLRSIANTNESREELKRQIYAALSYPIVLIIASIAVVVFMIMWIVPSFVSIFEKAGVPMPLPTRLLWDANIFLHAYGYALMILLVLAGVGVKILLRLPGAKYQWDQFWLKAPVIGMLKKRIEITRWSENLSLMLSSGVPLLRALDISRRLVMNAVFEKALQRSLSEIQSGAKLASALAGDGVFPLDVLQMIATGESSGTLDQMLEKVSVFYNQLVTRSLRKLTSVIEPVFILIMGVVVGFIMMSIFLPIFDMIKVLRPK